MGREECFEVTKWAFCLVHGIEREKEGEHGPKRGKLFNFGHTFFSSDYIIATKVSKNGLSAISFVFCNDIVFTGKNGYLR